MHNLFVFNDALTCTSASLKYCNIYRISNISGFYIFKYPVDFTSTFYFSFFLSLI